MGEASKSEFSTSKNELAGMEILDSHMFRPEDYSLLIVEDDIDQLALYCHFLRESGYCVSSASSVAEALSIMSQKSFDLVISDLFMPHQSGKDLLKMMRSTETVLHGPKVPVIILSAADAEIDAEMLDCGADSFCQKQQDCKILLEQIKILLDR